MGKTARGVRDGTGSHKGSYRSKTNQSGRRAAAGQSCPKKKK